MCHRVPNVACPAPRACLIWAGAAALLAGAPVTWAGESPDVLEDPWQLSLGSFIVDSDTDVRLDGDTQTGTNVDWENTFGGGEVTRFRIDGQWRFAERHKARFMWFNSSRSRSRTLSEEINWGDETFPVNAKVDGEFDFDVYELAYEYAFLRRDTYEVSGTIGLHYTELSLSLAAEAASSGGTLAADIKEEGSVGAPLPVIGLRGLWQLPHHFWIDLQAQFFAISIDEYDGNLQDYKIMATWQPKKWLGIGLGYNRFTVDVDVDADRFNGSLDWTYEGPMLSYSAVF
jgi:hypothetical protein